MKFHLIAGGYEWASLNPREVRYSHLTLFNNIEKIPESLVFSLHNTEIGLIGTRGRL